MTQTRSTTNSEFLYKIDHAPTSATLTLNLRTEQTVLAEAGAMAAMDSSIQMKSRSKGGLRQGIGRVLGGESLFLSEFTAIGKPGELIIAPPVPGNIRHYRLNGSKSLIVQSAGFVAASPTLQIDSKFQGSRGFFSGESLFLLRVSGTGDFWFSSCGAILEIPISGEYLVDTGYIAAFEDTLDYSVELLDGLSFRGLRSSILGGEGLVCRFRGAGKLWIQSRQLSPLINFFHTFRPVHS